MGKQKIDSNRNVFINMIKVSLNPKVNECINLSRWSKFVHRFGPIISKLYIHLQGITLSQTGELVPWIGFVTDLEAINIMNSNKEETKKKSSDNEGDEGD